MQKQREGIALLITIMFVMLISVAIGYALKEVNLATKALKEEQNLYQNSMILSDVLSILQSSSALESLADNNSSEELYAFLSSSGFYPIDVGQKKLLISIKSASSKLNINALNDITEPFFRDYFSKKMLNSNYVDVLRSFMSKNQAQNEYNNYTSVFFDAYPNIFREYIASKKHLEKINRLYMREYHDENLKNVDFEKLFCYDSDQNRSVDLNYASADVWELMLGVTPERAETLAAGGGTYKELQDLKLSELESRKLAKFHTSFFEPYLRVSIEVIDEEDSAKMSFEYAIKTKRGYNFVLEF